MKKLTASLLLFGFVGVSSAFFYTKTHATSLPSVVGAHEILTKTLHGKTLNMEIVSSPADIEEGLSDRVSMPRDQGMLFLFHPADRYSFWMQRMHFPLDIIWIRDGRVVDIAENMPAPQNFSLVPATYTPKAAADRVLEVNAGQAREYGLSIGAMVPID